MPMTLLHHILKAAFAVLLLVVAVPVHAGETLDEVVAALGQQGIVFDATNALRGAVTGLLQSFDPEARVLTAEQAAQLEPDLDSEAATAASGSVAGVRSPGDPAALATAEVWPEGIAYMKVRGLHAGSGAEILSHLQAPSGDGGIILDLRGAGGADLTAVVDIASGFRCESDTVFKVQNGMGVDLEMRKAGAAAPVRLPLMVLVDHDTVRAAELLAGVLKGCPRVMVIGACSRGDARLRKRVPLPDGRVAYVAARQMVLANGSSYEGKGIEPDVKVSEQDLRDAPARELPANGKPLSAKSVRDRELMQRVAGDPVLRRATDMLLGLKALGAYEQR
jgi:hypothetical protein